MTCLVDQKGKLRNGWGVHGLTHVVSHIDRMQVVFDHYIVFSRPDYLLYGRLYLPTGRLDALYSTRISPTLQAVVAAISDPRPTPSIERRGRIDNESNIMFNLQHDVGRWCTEYTYSAEDSMWGVRLLHNFGKLAALGEPHDDGDKTSPTGPRIKRVEEEDAMEGGLKGRISVGAEVYFSAKERSAGG
jgi:mitochondrial distribution and morphology protein 10